MGLDIVLLGHLLPVHADDVVPLETVGVTLVTLPVMSEVVHLVPVVLRFHKHVKCPAVAEMLLREYYGINLRVIALWRDVAHRKQLILLFCCDGLHISSVF